ncbi:hypothetical protein Amsp01_036900 [Amycolatopsis sp. NBRC 101858]|uniref:hypothetical protein n=1 Tax=Amycolatopsis sp. NBRC 101858 TaxID=3032200 RepID=UPI0024A3DB73|nr:hypothetical protein [Amycolatopsis sp. NBRC 101858]GLY37666.1 hypothetical protein Amsp01_036900 [Amycolatopsis sp. NBRC 101858]
MPDNELPGFLIIGLIFVIADGQILYRGGRRYLSGPDGADGTGAMARMVVTVFHLVAFGLLALLSVVGPGWSGSTAALVGRLGVFLLLLAVAHGVTIAVLGRRRQDTIAESRYQDREADGSGRPAGDAGTEQTTVTPVPGPSGPPPRVSPDLGSRGPYRA